MKCIFQKIQIHNFKSFADQEFDFSSRPGISTIVGVNNDIPGAANAAGKSSLFSALFYVLFGKDAVKTKNKFLKNRYVDSNEFSVKLYLTIDGKSFKIDRGSIGAASYLKLFDVNGDGSETEISKASILETECFLKHMLSNLTVDIFLKTVLLSPALGENFFMLSNKDKAEFLNLLSGTNRIYNINELVNKDILNLNTSIKILDNNLMSLSKQIDVLKKKRDDFINNQAIVRQKHDEQIEQYNKTIESDLIVLKEQTQKYDELKKKVDKLSSEKENATEQVQQTKMKMVSGASHVKTLQSKNEQLNSFISKNIELIDKLCDECRPKIDAFLNIETIQNSINENNKEIQKEKESLGELQFLLNTWNKMLNKIKTDLDEQSPELQEVYEAMNKTNASIESARKLIQTIETNSKNTSQQEPFTEMIETAQKDLTEKQNEKDSTAKERQKLALVKFITSDDVIHKFVISQFANDINLFLARYLSVMGVGYSIVFDNDLTYTFMTPVGEVAYDTFSSGEKMRLNIAISLAFRKLLFKYLNIDINTLILDEYIDSALDKLAISGIINLLNEICAENQSTNIYVVSHRSEVLSEFGGSRLIVKKTNGISEIVVEDE